jgi:hypothetical protein
MLSHVAGVFCRGSRKAMIIVIKPTRRYVFLPGQPDVVGRHAQMLASQTAIGTLELAHILKKALQMQALHGTFHIQQFTCRNGNSTRWIISSFISTAHG